MFEAKDLENQNVTSTFDKICNSKQRTGWASVFILSVICIGLVMVVLLELNINRGLDSFDLNYDGNIFGIITDIHLDLDQNDTHCRVGDDTEKEWINHYSTRYGVSRCDSSIHFLNITLAQFSAKLNEFGTADFIIHLGDTVGHTITGFAESLKAIQETNRLIGLYLPQTPVYFVLGNNDVPIDYQIPKHPENWYRSVWDSSFSLLHQSVKQLQDAADTFGKYGYYKITHDSTLWVVALNTIVFHNHCPVSKEVVHMQMHWLEETLANAHALGNVSVLLIGHIPAEIELIEVESWNANKTMTWKAEYIPEMNRIIGTYSGIIKLSFFSHQHSDGWFAKKTIQGGYVSHFVMPPVSPVSLGEPSFVIGIIDWNWDLLDLLFYFCPIDVFTGASKIPKYLFQYSFKQQNFHYAAKYLPANASLLEMLTFKLTSFDDVMSTYTSRLMNIYQLRYMPAVSPYQMFCVMTENIAAELDTCLKDYMYT